MEITIYQQIRLKNLRVFHDAYKSFESNVIPHKGDFIQDSAFKDPYEYEVQEVTIDYNEDTCSVRISAIDIDSEDKQHVKKYLDMMKLHGWKCNTYDLL